MIEINLLPGARRNNAASKGPKLNPKAMLAGVSSKITDKFLLGTVVVVALAAAAGGGLFVTQSRMESGLAERQERAVADSTRYAKFLKDRARAEAARDTLLRQVNIIRTLDEDRFIWAHVLDEVSRALPQYTWVTNLALVGSPQGAVKDRKSVV
jgi:Tfp pilus assembly protein PilN